MMPKLLTLDEATNIIGQINTLDAKLISLIQMYELSYEKMEGNKKEIERRKDLEKTNEELKSNLIKIKEQIEEIKGEIHSKTKVVTDSGWVVPIPKREIPNASSVRM
jgi:predicted RNase H-like nuclease (RuvC/YqgF family)